MAGFRQEPTLVFLPRFQVSYETTLNDALTEMGMGLAFTPQAAFPEMAAENIWIDWVRHRSWLTVDETGTEAASATVVRMKKGGNQMLRFNRPFLYAIRDTGTGIILFMGTVNDPSAG
jgi:serpin B